MDLVVGDASNLDALRDYGRVQDAIEDDRTAGRWDRACDLALEEVRPEFLTDCPPRVEEWALSTAMLLLRASQRGGTAVATPDGIQLPGGIGGAFDVRQRRGILGRQYGQPHVTVAGG